MPAAAAAGARSRITARAAPACADYGAGEAFFASRRAKPRQSQAESGCNRAELGCNRAEARRQKGVNRRAPGCRRVQKQVNAGDQPQFVAPTAGAQRATRCSISGLMDIDHRGLLTH